MHEDCSCKKKKNCYKTNDLCSLPKTQTASEIYITDKTKLLLIQIIVSIALANRDAKC